MSSSAAPAAPRPIKGTVGSRVRVVLGATGSDWVVLLDEDDGSREWQTHLWPANGGIPNGLANQLNNCTNKGRYVKEVDWGSRTYDSSWYVRGLKRDGSGSHAWWQCTPTTSDIVKSRNDSTLRASFGSDEYGGETYVLLNGNNGYQASGNLNEHLKSRLKEINEERGNIKIVRLFHSNAYFVSDSGGSQWLGVGEHCGKELKRGGQVEDVAVAGDGTWIIVRPSTYIASTGVDRALTDRLSAFYKQQRERNSNRSREINLHRERAQRETRERLERERTEGDARERAEREAEEARARAVREQRERAEREAKEREAKAEAERLAKAMAEKEEAEKASALASILEERILEDAKDIKLQEHSLQKRKRSLRDSIEKLPDAQRARIEQELSDGANGAGECVVCQHEGASRAVIPCGHQCLCDDCASKLAKVPPTAQLCPLCRGTLDGTLKIFTAR